MRNPDRQLALPDPDGYPTLVGGPSAIHPLLEDVLVEMIAGGTSRRRIRCQAGGRPALERGLRPVSPVACPAPAIVRMSWGPPGHRTKAAYCLRHSQAKTAQLKRRPIAEVFPITGAAPPIITVTTPPPPALPAAATPPRLEAAAPPRLEMEANPSPAEATSPTSEGTTPPTHEAAPPPSTPRAVSTAPTLPTAAPSERAATLLPQGEAATPPPVEATLSPPPERNPAFVYLARLGSGSRRTMREALDEIAGLVWGAKNADAARVPWHTISYAHTSTVRALLVDRCAPATVKKKLAAMRGVLREAWKLGLLSTDEYQKAVALEAVKGVRLPVGRALARDQVAALFATCARDPTAWGRRDAALLTLLFGAALRRAEACAVALADYDPQSGELVVRRGKGGKERRITLPPLGRLALAEWFAARGREPGPLLTTITPYGRVRTGRAMSDDAVYLRLQVLADRAGVARFSPHDARRTYLTLAIEEGVDLVTVMKLAGHAEITTTVRYDRREDRAIQEAAAQRFLPFQPAAVLPSPEAAMAPPTEAPTSPSPTPPTTSSSAMVEPSPSAPRETDPDPKEAPRIAPAARSRASTTRRPRNAKSARPAESRRKPGRAQRLRGRKSRSARRKA